jgi:hypothetical protein
MAIKVGGQELIANNGDLINFADMEGRHFDLEANIQTLGAGQGSIDCDHSFVKITMGSNNYPYTFTNYGVGTITNIILDTTSNAYDPAFDERETGPLYWPIAGEPTWNSHRYWLITVVGTARVPTSGVDLRASYFGYDDPAASGNPIPAGTFNADDNPDTGFSATDSDTASGGQTASSEARIYLRWDTHALTDIGTADFYGGSGDTTQYFSGGTPTSFTGDYAGFVSAGALTGVRIVYGPSSNPTLNDTGWKTGSDAHTGWTVYGSSGIASASGGGGNQDTSNASHVFTVWGRATGYDDTALATFKITAQCTATSTGQCFTGESKIALKNGDNVKLVAMEEAYHGWKAQQITNEISDVQSDEIAIGNDDVENKILDFRRRTGRYNLYGFNTETPFVTDSHPFLTTDGWKCINAEVGQGQQPELNITKIEIGDRLIKYNFITNSYYEEAITSINETYSQCNIYSVDVEGPDSESDQGNDTYIVNGYVVHNK